MNVAQPLDGVALDAPGVPVVPIDADLEAWVFEAIHGDQLALARVVEAIQSKVYNLAIRMLRSPADADDATQEILIRVITHLSEFRAQSAFTTWVYRIASNYLLNASNKNMRTPQAAFEELGQLLDTSLAHSAPDPAEVLDEVALTTEVRRSCTLGMLRCLDRDQRIALILGELFEVTGEDAAYILNISPAAFRKRLSRARAALVAFVSHRCGIVNPASPCRCDKHINNLIQAGRLEPNHLRFVPNQSAPTTQSEARSQQQYVLAQSQELNAVCRTSALMRAHPSYAPSGQVLDFIQSLIQDPKSRLFENTAFESR